jgi:hypothetical protein
MTHARLRLRVATPYALLIAGYVPLGDFIDPEFDEVANDHEPSCEGLDHLLHHYRAGHDNLTP